jgi:hypothetical protein
MNNRNNNIQSDSIMKKTLFILILTIIGIPAFQTLKAQTTTMYGMKHIPQYGYDNPARQPACKLYIGFPALNSVGTNVQFTGLSLNDIISPNTQNDSFRVDLNNIADALGNSNLLGIENHLSIIEFGFSLEGNQYITFSVRNKTQQFFSFSDQLLDIRNGNYKTDGSPIVFDLKERFINYNEYSLGYSYKMLNNLTIGGRLNVYSGNAFVNTNKLNIQWHTGTGEEEMYPWRWVSDVNIQAAAIPDWEITEDENGVMTGLEYDEEFYKTKPARLAMSKNFGMGLDAGVNYRMYDWLNLSASVKDFGFIKWKTNAKEITQKGEFEFSGIDIADYFENISDLSDINLGDTILQEFTDTLLQEFLPAQTNKSFTSFMSSKFFAGAEFHVTDWLDFGALYHGMLINKHLYSSLSVSANANFWKGWAVSLNYAIANRAYNNIGVGLAYKLGPLQMYFITDNIAPALYMWDKEFTRDHLYNTKSVNLHFGINFLFCGPKHDYGLMF